MSTAEIKEIERVVKAAVRSELKRFGIASQQQQGKWVTAKQTGMTAGQRQHFRETYPDRVKPARANTRSYLYLIQ